MLEFRQIETDKEGERQKETQPSLCGILEAKLLFGLNRRAELFHVWF